MLCQCSVCVPRSIFVPLQEKRDLVTGLKARAKAGRPDWDAVFSELKSSGRGAITVFCCGKKELADAVQKKCEKFGFAFRNEVF